MIASEATFITLEVPNLCRHPNRLLEALEGTEKVDRLVLGLCSGKYSLGEVQSQIRKARLDPLGVEILHLDSTPPEKVGVLLAGAVARARAFEDSSPDHAKVHLSPRLSGRALFKVNIHSYRAVPALNHSLCAVDKGCKLCVKACPHEALISEAGFIRFEKADCTSCGLCLTACPTGALTNPACTPAQLEAQVRALLESAPGPAKGIIFQCRADPAPPDSEGWYPVTLPCVGMAPTSWLLAPLLMGAGAVALAPCEEGCPPVQHKPVESRLDFCHRFLETLGAPTDMVRLASALEGAPPPIITLAHPLESFSLQATASVLTALAEAFTTSMVCLDHPASPLGIVELNPKACTRCGRCAQVCPTGALAYESQQNITSLSFEAGLCIACRLCLPVCPELSRKAISLAWRVDLEAIHEARRVLFKDKKPACQACGQPIAPPGVIERVTEMLGDEYAATLPLLTNYCPACRGGPALPNPTPLTEVVE